MLQFGQGHEGTTEMMIPLIATFALVIFAIAALVVVRLMQTGALRADLEARGFTRQPFRLNRAFHYSMPVPKGRAEVFFSKVDSGQSAHYSGSATTGVTAKFDLAHVFKYTLPDELSYALEIDSMGSNGKAFSISTYPPKLAEKLKSARFEEKLVQGLTDRGPLFFKMRDDAAELWATPINDGQVIQDTLNWLAKIHDEVVQILR